MRGFTFISKLITSLFLALVLFGGGGSVYAADGQNSPPSKGPEEDIYTTPYTEYGTFNEDVEEEEAIRFFQYGRFFGVSLGGGLMGATGNRGLLWSGGFPMLELRVHYWFDFNFALQMNIFSAPFNYNVSGLNNTDISMVNFGIDLKYYFNTQNMPAAISFANPYVMIGAGSMTKTETDVSAGTKESENAANFSGGMGFEFTLKPKKTYFTLDGRLLTAHFKDTNTNRFSKPPVNIPDLTGWFYTLTAGILFTW